MREENKNDRKRVIIREIFKVSFKTLQFMLMLVQFAKAISETKLFGYVVEVVKLIIKVMLKK